MPGLMALRERYGGQEAARGRAHHGLAAHDRADRGAHRDARRARRRRALGVVQHLLDAGPRRRGGRRRPARTGGTSANPKGTPVFAWKGETLEEYWWCTDEALDVARRQRPDADRRRRRRRDAARAQGRSSTRRPARCRRSTPTSDPEEWGVILELLRGELKARPGLLDQDRQGHPRRQRGDDHRRAPPLPDDRSRARCSSRPSTSTTRSPRASSTTSTAAATR